MMQKQKKPQPIVPWMGGKRRLAKYLLPLFPQHTCYVELFAGGAALFFMKEQSKVEVLNDINGDLVNLYRVVNHHYDEFIKHLEFLCCSRELFGQLKATPSSVLTDVQRAVKFFYIQQHCFGGRSDNATFGTATTAKPFNHLNVAERLKVSRERLAGVYIENESWEKCFKRYDREHTFFYADPPYLDLSGYGVDFPIDEYHKLAGVMRSAKGKVMLSINDCEQIREIFKGLTFHEVKTTYSVGLSQASRGEKSELIICNY